jgi:hypothetical protein
MNGESLMAKTAGTGEQKLPFEFEIGAGLAKDRSAAQHLPDPPSAPDSPTSLLPLNPLQPNSSPETARALDDLAQVAPTDPTERVFAAMNAAVVRLHRTGEDEYQISIQPDPDTEIRLRVSLHGNSTEIHAELRRGDGGALAGHWQELQERLSHQGISLAPLGTESTTSLSQGTSSGFSSPDRRTPAEPERFPTPPTTILPPRPAPGRTALVPRMSGWETWA